MNLDNLVTLDCEVFPNYFLVSFKNIEKGRFISLSAFGDDSCLDVDQRKRLNTIMRQRVTFGFNSNGFDIPIILFALAGKTCAEIHSLCEYIINEESPSWQTMRRFDLVKPKAMQHFDIKEPAPGVMISLKLYGGRIHSKRLQDLPYPPGTILTRAQADEVELYCANDLETNIDLFRAIEKRIELRVDMSAKYGVDLMSKSDAQIAETVIKAGLPRARKPTLAAGSTFKYKAPKFIRFESEVMRRALATIEGISFELDKKGSIKLPPALKKLDVTIGGTGYKVGIGGLHSMEKGQTVRPQVHQILADRDVTSFYPFIILILRLFPKHLGDAFLTIYRGIVFERLAAKRPGDTFDQVVADSLKIVINGSFGKLGSKYSALYSPGLMLTVTMTGQLVLLMLIEKLEANNIKVVSANTDGFVSLMHKDDYDNYDALCLSWELSTGFELEETLYNGLYSRDVNNYMADMGNGKTKGKGIFKIESLEKNPVTEICVIAAERFLTDGVPVADTIRGCSEVSRFVIVRTSNGGATWCGDYLGRVARWYYSKSGHPILNKVSGNKVAKSDGAKPMMMLADKLPADLDFDKYEFEANKIIESTGFYNL